MSERLLRQFNKLQKIEPSSVWQESTRNILVTKVSHDTLGRKMNALSKARIFGYKFSRKIAPLGGKLMAAAIILTLLGGTNMFAQAEYIPGKGLYPVKTLFENFQKAIALTPESVTKVNLKHANKRKDEAVKIAQTQSLTPAEKTENINKVVKSLEQNITAATNSLEIVKQNENKPQEAVNLAKQVNKNVTENIKDLSQVQEVMAINDNEADGQMMTEVLTELEEAENTSIAVLIETVEVKSVDCCETESKDNNMNVEPNPTTTRPIEENTSISEEEVKQLLNEKIDRADQKIKKLEEKIKEALTVDISATVTATAKPDSKTSIMDVQIRSEVIKSVQKKSKTAQEILNEVRDLVNKGSLTEALAKVKETSKLTKESEEVIAKIEQVIKQAKDGQIIPVIDDSGELKGSLEIKLPTTTVPTTTDPLSTTTPSAVNPEVNILNYAPLGGQVIQAGEIVNESAMKDLEYLQESEVREFVDKLSN